MSQIKNKKETIATAVVTWASGRTEQFSCKIKSNGAYPKNFNDRVAKNKAVPTVKSVVIERR